MLALFEMEGRRGARIVERLQSTPPVDVERSDAMDLHDGLLGSVAEHRASFGCESITSRRQLLQRLGVELFAMAKIPGALHDGDVLIHRMRMRRDHRARQFPDTHDEWLAGDFRIAVEDLHVA